MMRTITAVLLFFAFAQNVHGQDLRQDGNWWKTQSGATRSVFLLGMIEGMTLGRNFSVWDQMGNDYQQNQCLVTTLNSYQANLGKLENVTVGQMSDGLTDFYSDFRNRTILTRNAVWIVANQISGMPEQDVISLTERFRANASKEL